MSILVSSGVTQFHRAQGLFKCLCREMCSFSCYFAMGLRFFVVVAVLELRDSQSQIFVLMLNQSISCHTIKGTTIKLVSDTIKGFVFILNYCPSN